MLVHSGFLAVSRLLFIPSWASNPFRQAWRRNKLTTMHRLGPVDAADVNVSFLPQPRTPSYHFTTVSVPGKLKPHITSQNPAVYYDRFNTAEDVKTHLSLPSFPVLIATTCLARSDKIETTAPALPAMKYIPHLWCPPMIVQSGKFFHDP